MIFYWVATAFSPSFKIKSFEELPKEQETEIISLEKQLFEAPLVNCPPHPISPNPEGVTPVNSGFTPSELDAALRRNPFFTPPFFTPEGSDGGDVKGFRARVSARKGLRLEEPLRGKALTKEGEFPDSLLPLRGLAKANLFNLANLAKITIIISNILLGILLLIRWKDSGHFPLSNLYESLMFLSWCFTGIQIFIENYRFFYSPYPLALTLALSPSPPSPPSSPPVPLRGKGRGRERGGEERGQELGQALTKGANTKNNEVQDSFLGNFQSIELLGAITTPSALLTNAFATFTLPSGMHEILPLVPALKSNWLIMHVTVMILSYAALIIGSLLSIAFLIITAGEDNWITPLTSEGGKVNEAAVFTSPPPSGGVKKGYEQGHRSKGKNLAVVMDNLSYRILGIAFPLLTIGILSGAVWANEAWGSYWSWDPKETWALLTWFVFAIYLHTRLSKGWTGKRPAIIASIGFVVVWVCYLGVNLIGEGLHSYGWLS